MSDSALRWLRGYFPLGQSASTQTSDPLSSPTTCLITRRKRFSYKFKNSWRFWGLYGAEFRVVLDSGIRVSDLHPRPFTIALMSRRRAIYSYGFRSSNFGLLVPFSVIRVTVSDLKDPGFEVCVTCFSIGFRLQVPGSRFPVPRIRDLGFRESGTTPKMTDSVFRVLGSPPARGTSGTASGCFDSKFRGSGRVSGSGIREDRVLDGPASGASRTRSSQDPCLGYRVPGSVFRVSGAGIRASGIRCFGYRGAHRREALLGQRRGARGATTCSTRRRLL